MTYSFEALNLLNQIHSIGVPLSQNIVQALRIAQNLQNESLYEFCKNELEGYPLEEIPPHRLVNGFASLEQIEFDTSRLVNSSIAVACMERNPNFYPKNWYIRHLLKLLNPFSD